MIDSITSPDVTCPCVRRHPRRTHGRRYDALTQKRSFPYQQTTRLALEEAAQSAKAHSVAGVAARLQGKVVLLDDIPGRAGDRAPRRQKGVLDRCGTHTFPYVLENKTWCGDKWGCTSEQTPHSTTKRLSTTRPPPKREV